MAHNNDPPIRLLIVENQTALADALAAALVQRGNIHIVGITPDGTEAVDLVKKLQEILSNVVDGRFENGVHR